MDVDSFVWKHMSPGERVLDRNLDPVEEQINRFHREHDTGSIFYLCCGPSHKYESDNGTLMGEVHWMCEWDDYQASARLVELLRKAIEGLSQVIKVYVEPFDPKMEDWGGATWYVEFAKKTG